MTNQNTILKKNVSNKLLIFLLSLFIFSNSFGQIEIVEGEYTTWSGKEFAVYIIEGEYTVLKIDTAYISAEQLKDTSVLSTIIDRIDSYYTSYMDFCGKEPQGGDANFNYKSSVAFASPTCGAACGLIGSKGIEAGPNYFLQIFNETKYQTHTNRIGIIGYEFGRNFFTISDKLLFPTNSDTVESNGGFAEGFATVGGLVADLKYFNELDSTQKVFQESLAYEKQLKNYFKAYVNDTLANPYNALAQNYMVEDVNRNTWGFKNPPYLASAILQGIDDNFNTDKLFSSFFAELEDRSLATSVEDALSNLAYCFSKAINYNLYPFFSNVLKFKLNQNTINEIQNLPLAPNKLIKDMDKLWFLTPFDTIPLNIRSVNYQAQDNYYQIFVGDSLYNETLNGNNSIDYSYLQGKDSVVLKVKLLDSDRNLVDEQNILLTKRNNINMSDYFRDFYIAGTDGYSSPDFIDETFVLSNLAGKVDYGLLEMPFPVKNNRLIEIKGKIRNQAQNCPSEHNCYSFIALSGYWSARVGYDVGKEDYDNFFDVKININTNDIFTGSEDSEYIINKFYIRTSLGITKGYFKEIYYNDITDTDGDGFIDFDDKCPNEYGINNGCPNITNVEDFELVKSNVFPNPNNGSFTLSLNNPTHSDITLLLFNQVGQIVEQRQIKPFGGEVSERFDISHMSKGMYFLKINSIMFEEFKKIVIQ